MLLSNYLASKLAGLSFLFSHEIKPALKRPSRRSPSHSEPYRMLCPDRKFPSVGTVKGCITSEIFGVLPKDPLYRVVLRSEHLRKTPGALAAVRVEKTNTHQFWAWVQKRHSKNSPCHLVYCIQVDLSHQSQKSWGGTFSRRGLKKEAQKKKAQAEAQTDACSIYANNALASFFTMQTHGHWLMEETDEFWCLVIETAYNGYWAERSQYIV